MTEVQGVRCQRQAVRLVKYVEGRPLKQFQINTKSALSRAQTAFIAK